MEVDERTTAQRQTYERQEFEFGGVLIPERDAVSIPDHRASTELGSVVLYAKKPLYLRAARSKDEPLFVISAR
jgi:hypothetical protein